jgi:hypothetical protein
MSSLVNQKIKDTYEGLIKTSDDQPIGGTLKNLQDGNGGVLPIQVSTSTINFTGTVTGINAGGMVPGTATDSIKSADTLTTNAATASANDTIAIGNGASATSGSNIAIGENADAGGDDFFDRVNIAIGKNTVASNERCIAIGLGADATGDRGISMGEDAQATGNQGPIAIGQQANASGANGVSVGRNSTASSTGTVAVGDGADARSVVSVAVGANSDITSNATYGIALGSGSRVATSISNIGIGLFCSARGTDNIMIGHDAGAGSGFDSLANRIGLGKQPQVGTDSIIIGNQAVSPNTGSGYIAIGHAAESNAAGAVAIGNSVTASTADTVTIKRLQMLDYASLNYADDTAAAAGGVPLGGVYHTSGALKIRIA